MTTIHSREKQHVPGVPESNAAVTAATAIVGALSGAAVGAIAGVVGLVAGAALGAIAGAATGQRLAIKQREDEQDDERLDEDIGVISGAMGAPQERTSAWVGEDAPAPRAATEVRAFREEVVPPPAHAIPTMTADAADARRREAVLAAAIRADAARADAARADAVRTDEKAGRAAMTGSTLLTRRQRRLTRHVRTAWVRLREGQ